MITRQMHPFIFLIVVLGALLTVPTQGETVLHNDASLVAVAQVEVEPELLSQLEAGGTLDYVLVFHDRPDLSPAYHMEWEERGQFVVQALKTTADESQSRARAYLDAQGVSYQAFWVDNVIMLEQSDISTLTTLLEFPEIAVIRLPIEIFIPRDVFTVAPYTDPTPTPTPDRIEANLTWVKAPLVWSMGFRGEGITVATIDSGVRYTHQALRDQYRGNLGGGDFDHNYNWWDPHAGSDAPNDHDGHGTHVTGIIVGYSRSNNQFYGMAPDAQWIACKGYTDEHRTENGFLLTESGFRSCGEFLLKPWDLNGENPDPNLRPHIINNSWGDCSKNYREFYRDIVDSWHAAGIYPVFSSGNAFTCNYPSPPGRDTVTNPARYGNVTAVGSTGRNNGQYASHSHWGPTDNPDTINARGYPNLKPQVVAPGVEIRSSFHTSDSDYSFGTGTSQSAPHVSGLVALMWQAAPCLMRNYASTETILEQTATPIPYATGNGDEGPGNVPNHATGWGEINALEAVLTARSFCKPGVSVALIIDASGSMVWNDPDDMRKAGAQAFVDATQVGDKIAVVAFSSEAQVIAPLTTISSADDRIALKSLIDQIGAQGWTDVNGGLNDGFSELLSDTSNNHKAAVLLTDGEHNVDPYDPQSHLQYADEGWPIYTIGLGDADLAFLDEIASETGGKCWNNCTVLTTPSDLATLYTEILADLAGANTLLSTRIQLAQGETQELAAGLPPIQSGATFFISWPGSEVSLSLVSPSCRHINPATVAADVYHAKGTTYEIYTISHPEPGQWRLEIYGTDIPAGGTDVDVRIFSRGNKFLYLPLVYENHNPTTAGNTNVIATTEVNFTPRDVTSVSCPPPPQAPANLQATPIDISRIQLTWDDNADNESGFSIYESTTLVATVERNSTSHIVEGLGINSRHCYRIQAFNNYGNSLWSNDACAATDSLPLTGTVTDNNVPVAGTGISLLFYNGTSYSTYATTTTDANGNYQFTNFPSLSSNQWLIVHWVNSSGNVSRLSRWYCRAITWLTIDPTAYICNFDLENMDMLLPAHGQTVTLPYTFTWDKRILTSDNYRLSLADVNNNYDPWWLTSSLGHVDSYTMNGLPSGFVPNKNYGWWLYVFGPDGYGLSRYYYVVKFSNTGTTVLESTPLPAFLLEEEIDLLVPFETP
jgi:subtilisin family serine protease